MTTASQSPTIPESSSTVDVSIIDSTCYLAKVAGDTIIDPVYPGYEWTKIPSYSFLIHHKASNSRILYDLGLRTNWRTHLSPKLIRDLILPLGIEITVEKNVSEILEENGVSLNDVNHIILSHHHWDHVGDTTLFPPSTTVIVGPGYKKKYLPGWPKDPDAIDTTSDLYEGRETVEVDFSVDNPQTKQLGSFEANDFFGDGSFYILNSPGHTTGHLCALARTTFADGRSSFIFLAGDIAHHCLLFRPTEHKPLPEVISPAPYDQPFAINSSCESAMYVGIHRSHEGGSETKARTTPFCCVPSENNPVDEDPVAAQATLMGMLNFDGDEDIFTIFAHDATLLDVVDFFPKQATDWKAKRWGEVGHWRFLAPLKTR